MWTRLKRLFRSIFGGLISDAEDPELILNQLMRDMQDEVPKMRNNVAQVMAGEERLAQTMSSFQMGDNSQTFDDMREKIANRVAGAEARAELASTGLDSRMQSIDREIANFEAQDMLQAYKQQMGLAPAAPQAALG